MTISKTKLYLVLAITIFMGAAVFRLADLPERAIFTEDNALFNIFTYKNAIYHEPLVCGPNVSGVWAVFPPTLYQIIAPLNKITNFDYYTLNCLTIAVDLLAILFMISFLPGIVGKKAAVIISFLYSFSFYVTSQSIAGTNSEMIPPLVVLLFISSVWYFRDRKLWALPIAAFCASLMTHFHATAFFVLPGFGLLFLLYFRNFKIKHLVALGLAGLVILYAGIRPHYLENKAFGGQNFEKVKTALINNSGSSKVSKLQSSIYFLTALSDINSDLLFPNSVGFQDTVKTIPPLRVFGGILSLALLGFAIYHFARDLKKPTAVSILAIIFLSNLFFQTVAPTYFNTYKPMRWLDGVYFPLYILLLGLFVSNLIKKIIRYKLVKVILPAVIVIFLAVNIQKWVTDAQAEDRIKLKTIIKAARVASGQAQFEQNINLMSIGSVNLHPAWPFAFAMWKESENDKYLRTLLWNIDPKQNEPFYIFSSSGDTTFPDEEKLAKNWQDNPKVIKTMVAEDFFVEKVFNGS